jgi:polyhydroxyalkanoate synthesis repressor PhaR
LAEIKQLVMDSEVFSVRDAKTGEDLTRSILLQIILEEEANGSPMFTAPVLSNVIRFYGHTMQGFMGGYLEKNMQALMDMQVPMVQGVMGNNVFQQMQDQMQKQTEQFLGTFGIKR